MKYLVFCDEWGAPKGLDTKEELDAFLATSYCNEVVDLETLTYLDDGKWEPVSKM